jgi:hypothetical protein
MIDPKVFRGLLPAFCMVIGFSQAGGSLYGQDDVNQVMKASDGGAIRKNAAVGQAESDTLPGDVMAPWEGGRAYFSRWIHGPSTDNHFFPIAVWLQSPENKTTATDYKRIGINTHIGLWEGPTEKQLSAIASLSTTVICDQNPVGLSSAHNGVITAWAHQDEPDNAQGGTQDPVPTAEIVGRYDAMRANDPTRPSYLNFGQGVACDAWYGRGNRTNHPEDYAEYSKGADIVSFDIYPMNVFPLPNSSAPWFRAFHNAVAQHLWYVADGVDSLRKWTRYAKPVWAWIECTNINGDSRYALTSGHVKSEVWMAVIHGAGGIGYFCHQFSPSFIEAGLLAEPQMRDAVSAVNAQITSLAPVLNTQSVDNGVTTVSGNPSIRVDTMVKRSGGCTYLFTVAMRPGSTTATFTLRDFTGHSTVEAVGEGRNLTSIDGVFHDEFSDHEVHIYRVSNPGATDHDDGNTPIRQNLHQNYPNPFNRSTNIQYTIKEQSQPGLVTLKICNLLGGEVAVLVNEKQSDGDYHVEFSPERYGLSSGVFICDLRVGKQGYRKKMLYIR